MAIFCKLGANGFVASIVLVILMLLTQVTGIFLVDKVIKFNSYALISTSITADLYQ